MEHISRMAAEVNKLIGGRLLAGETLYLPEVGSLYIIVNSVGKKKIEFSSNQHGTSLISVIESRANCQTKQAVEIYNKWLSEVSNEQITTIEGVGVLRGGSFVTANNFSMQLNPGYSKVKMEKEKKREKKRIAPIFIILIILLLLGVVGYYIGKQVKRAKVEKAHIEAVAQAKAAEQQRIADSVNLVKIEAVKAQERLDVATTAAQGARYKVVYGVFDLRSNVENAFKNIPKIAGSHEPKEYPFNNKTLVSMFESDDRGECQTFLMTNYDNYPDTWIYDSQQ
ncbi:MAG: hypothetical protein R3Y08_09135 [Rikenellaceae bacterium]